MNYVWLGLGVLGIASGISERDLKTFCLGVILFFAALGTIAGIPPLD